MILERLGDKHKYFEEFILTGASYHAQLTKNYARWFIFLGW